MLFILLMATLGHWYWSLGTVSVSTIVSPKAEMFYWATIMFSQTLGTGTGRLYGRHVRAWLRRNGALVFGAALAVIAALYFFTGASRTLLFWAAFILTRPLGVLTVGDLLDKPVSNGGFALGRFEASGVLMLVIIACVLILPQRAGQHPGTPEAVLGAIPA